MTLKKSKTQIASAVSLALSSMMLAGSLSAGTLLSPYDLLAVHDEYTTGAANPTTAGSWNLTNVTVYSVINDVLTVDEYTDAQLAAGIDTLGMTDGYSFQSNVYDPDTTSFMAKVTGKDWPVGGPTGIKAVNNDLDTKNGKPENCIINTSFLDTGFLDVVPARPVICSSPFQSHKRFKVAMQPATTDGIVGVGSGTAGKPIDLVFNMGDDVSIRPYQVFSKINNYTNQRLAGYKIVVGKGVGTAFRSASDLGIADELFFSLGIAEGEDNDGNPDGSNIFDGEGLATFSHGLFGPVELPHFPETGFFSATTAFFPVDQKCTSYANPLDLGADVPCPVAVGTDQFTDTIYSTGVLSANYTDLFGAWLPSIWAPKGVFFDDDGNPDTDAELMAWWDGDEWRKGQADGFAVVSAAEFSTWSVDQGYSIDVIEDVLNLGPNYIVKVGDVAATLPAGQFTVRIIPVVAADQTEPDWVGTTPTALPLTAPAASGGGGGCAIGGTGRFDPTLPALLAAGLGFFGWRRFKAGK